MANDKGWEQRSDMWVKQTHESGKEKQKRLEERKKREQEKIEKNNPPPPPK